jgi:hypothetical protein
VEYLKRPKEHIQWLAELLPLIEPQSKKRTRVIELREVCLSIQENLKQWRSSSYGEAKGSSSLAGDDLSLVWGRLACGPALLLELDFLGWRDEWKLARGKAGGIGKLPFGGLGCDWLIRRMEGVEG